jgi:mycoredoxin-dependent peroxiredoxin
MALVAAGTPAPTFKGVNLTGPEVNLENYKGKKAVALIFAPDRVDPTSTNQVRSLYAKIKDRVEIITVSRKVPTVAGAKAFLQGLGVTFPTLYDPAMNVYKMYGVENPVAVFIIDTKGNIVYSAQTDPTRMDLKQLEEAIAANVKS